MYSSSDGTGENHHAIFATALKDAWAAVCPSGSCVLAPMDTDAKRYAAKAVYPDLPPDRLIMSPNLAATDERPRGAQPGAG